MRAQSVFAAMAAMWLAACGQSSPDVNSSAQTKKAVQEQEKPRAYCFFKDDEMKGWKASRDSHGDIAIEGQAHVKDPRYKAAFGRLEVGPKKAIASPTITQNDTGYAAPGDWWKLGAVIPNSGSVTEADVQCGDKVVAVLQAPARS